MSNLIKGGNGSAGSESNANNLESLLAQLRRQSGPDSPTLEPAPAGPTPDLLSQFDSYQHGEHEPSMYVENDDASRPLNPSLHSSAIDSSLFPVTVPTPPVHFGGSQFPHGMMGSMVTARERSEQERTTNLLNLLKFNGQGSHTGSQQAPRETIIHAPAPATADPTGLLAALIKDQPESARVKTHTEPVPTWVSNSSQSETQQYLLNLLNRPKPGQSNASPATESLAFDHQSLSERNNNTADARIGRANDSGHFGLGNTDANRASQLAEYDGTRQLHPATNSMSDRLGGYANPFEEHSGSSSSHRTPKSSSPGASGNRTHGAFPTRILMKSDPSQAGYDANRPSSRRSLETMASPANQSQAHNVPSPQSHASGQHGGKKNRSSVAEAIHELSEKADAEAQETIDRAEEELARETDGAEVRIAKTLEDIDSTQNDEELADSAQKAAQATQKELDKAGNESALESVLDPQGAREVQAIVKKAAQGQAPVANSWESAEADDIIMVEDMPEPVKVYNFPMKPWIAISVQDTDLPRATFRDDAILDIARLKKDFDQIDRNLVASSESYLAYGMSKAGGLRILRQEDGKDARLFTDTKDRIFNVAIATSAAGDHAQKEAIIGTGVSGTVYWVQLKNGNRDYSEDAHSEQNGFALPPIPNHEGDASGGVLKTRARPSAGHPSYFAVGRGKSINIIWPSYVFENNLFKNGHGRVVDTEKLLKQCSLKINIGKAGKDFTFSQDDTAMVSLDKSGRVKFWDVRDLTAQPEGSELPTHTSLEVKEPLLTLWTTPEGEKAWPTSVLLLDKYRPYQKRTALRYMVVGMKQNHTLQLWDLALNKPVQEFHFPHNKESDAVCSVMYHAPTSMIIVGHPTRNSIYFLHLSAPKYTMNTLSQVEFVQKLVSQDTSIPVPESTAVISGIREYSFANKGMLRSLNIMENASSHSDCDEPTLFELYAMHSKGVTCLYIRQAELGWTKDNKVICGVDALKAGLVTINKFHLPPSSLTERRAEPTTSSVQPIRIAIRGAKDGLYQKMPPLQSEDSKALEIATPTKLEQKEGVDTPAPLPEKAPGDKRERNRKKRAINAAASLQANSERDVNGSELTRQSSQTKTPAFKASRNILEPHSMALANLNQANVLVENLASTSDRLHAFTGTLSNLELNIAGMEKRIVSSLSGRIDSLFKGLNEEMHRMQELRDQDFMKNQAQLIQMVSQVLSENTEAVLKGIVIEQFEKIVKPSMAEQLRTQSQKLNTHVAQTLKQEVNHAVQLLLPQALQNVEVVKAVSDGIINCIMSQLEAVTAKVMNSAFSNVLPRILSSAMQQMSKEIHESLDEMREQMRQNEGCRGAKLDQVTANLSTLAETMNTVAGVQAQMQQDLVVIKQHMRESTSHQASASQSPMRLPVQLRDRNGGNVAGSLGSTSAQNRRLEEEAAAIDGLMREHKYDEAMILWLRSGPLVDDMHKRVISKYTPHFMRELQPLVLLSVATAITEDINGLLGQPGSHKVAMVNMTIHRFQQLLPTLQDPQVREVTPKIMHLLKTRLELAISKMTQVAPHDSSLHTLTTMANAAGRIFDAVRNSVAAYSSSY